MMNRLTFYAHAAGCCALVFFVGRAMAGPAVLISVDPARPGATISPLIYGINFNDFGKRPDIAFSRQGGNRFTAYNWETNASNAGNDFHFQNDGFLGASESPGKTVEDFVAPAMALGKTVLVTIPMIGHVAADKNGNGDVNKTPDFLNTRFVRSIAKKGKAFTFPPDIKDRVVYQDEFVAHLEKSIPVSARHGGDIFYSLDNEPDLWSSTHARVHPDKITYAELVDRTVEYATAIKAVNSKATIFGFASYGYNGYTTLQNAPDANGRNFVDFFLDAMTAADKRAGHRVVDVLDLHYYSEARGGGHRVNDDVPASPEIARARVQSIRSLDDANYVEESWIAKDAVHGPINLIPNLKAQISKHDPGIKLAFTEYDFGGKNDASGLVAQADALGIFGRDGVFAASLWGGGPVQFSAFDSFLNYDHRAAHFGDTVLPASTSDAGNVGVYASSFQRAAGKVVLIMTNRSTEERPCEIKTAGYERADAAYWSYTFPPVAAPVPVAARCSGPLQLSIKPMSVTVVQLTKPN